MNIVHIVHHVVVNNAISRVICDYIMLFCFYSNF